MPRLGLYCQRCETMTGCLDDRPEWWSPPAYRCSSCGCEVDKSPEEEIDLSDEGARLANGFAMLSMNGD